ncbi:hypothetical protein LOTGIDRAFT_214000 [Lottia gigantea]|uniref:Sulfotransferase domain-containing protein n=1 Tax=Lottia gigantea TaxID=225164 RepID=V4ATZ0_LOTGI|nr:hypothetical protein LOTGIDRAFT_214000 [Lottia gigantea]ESO98385.1 hypothetical protein LOTGIDRAFT_214000 [Lottia gigantea]
MDTTSEMLSMHPKRYNPKFKNPCWYEDLTVPAVYAHNKFSGYFHSVKTMFRELTNIWQKTIEEDSNPKRLRCLPYFFIAGQPKCGSTDLYQKISSHPDVSMPPNKEYHWWARRRFGSKSNNSSSLSFDDYTDLFDKVALYIEHVHDSTRAGDQEDYHPLITGDASASTLWDNDEWWSLKENCGATEPRFTNADYIHHFLPHAKIIVILRDPVDRLWSDYLYFLKSMKSAEDFHKNVAMSIDSFETCLLENTFASCINNKTIANLARVRLRIGIYYSYIETWLNIYPRDQFFILRLEDYASNIRNVMKRVFKFLGLRDLTREEADYILGQPVANTRKKGDRKFGKMKEETRKLLGDFYEPYNKKLSALLNDNRFMWKDKSDERQKYATESSVFDELGDYREKRSGRSLKGSSHSKLLKSLRQRIKNCEDKNT